MFLKEFPRAPYDDVPYAWLTYSRPDSPYIASHSESLSSQQSSSITNMSQTGRRNVCIQRHC